MLRVFAFFVAFLIWLAPSHLAAQDTCEQLISCEGGGVTGTLPDCRCLSCAADMDNCPFPNVASGTWPQCFCAGPEPVTPKGFLNPCEQACVVGRGTGTWPDCVCEPSMNCNPHACPWDMVMVGVPPFCRCEMQQMLPPQNQ
jgi:hypothetical protein